MSEVDETTFRTGIGIGIVLVAVGIGAYGLTGFASATALIPAIFGVLFVALGRVGLNVGQRQVAVYGLGLLALLGVAGSAQGVVAVVSVATGAELERPIADGSQAVMAILCLVVLVMVGRSIADGRSG